MNWLVIAHDAEKTEKLRKTLLLNDSQAVVTVMESGKNAADSMLLPISKADHCVTLLSSSKECTPDVSYIIGYFLGRKIPVYTTFEFFPSGNKISASLKYFKSIDLLTDHIGGNYKKIVQNQRQRESYEYLFKNGFPFTSAAFSANIVKGKIDVCRKYLEAGMDVNTRDADGTPVLNVAIRAEQTECISWLLDSGADINTVSEDRGYTPLMDAVWRGNEAVAQLLIERGAKMNTVNKEGQTMLVLAVGAGREKICRLLVENGEDPDVKDSMGMSAYEYAKLFRKNGIVELLGKYHK